MLNKCIELYNCVLQPAEQDFAGPWRIGKRCYGNMIVSYYRSWHIFSQTLWQSTKESSYKSTYHSEVIWGWGKASYFINNVLDRLLKKLSAPATNVTSKVVVTRLCLRNLPVTDRLLAQMANDVIFCRDSFSVAHAKLFSSSKWNTKQRVLMHGHQGWNVRHGLCHIYMRYIYIYIYELFIAFVSFVVCSLL